MKHLFTLLFCLYSSLIFAQSEEKVVRIQDFNDDLINDTLTYELFYGYTNFLIFTDGNSHQSYELYREDSKASFLTFVSIPEEFLDGRHQALLDSVEYRLCRIKTAHYFSPSMKWLMNAYAKNDDKPTSTYFSQTIQAPLNWQNWPPELPYAGYSFVDSDSLPYPLIYDPDKKTYVKKSDAGKGWLLYFGHNHRLTVNSNKNFTDFFSKIDSTESHDLYASSHGLILKNDQQYSWIFHTDIELTGGPEKLRWPSMDTVFIYRKHVFIHHISPITQQNRIFIINLENGMLGKLKLQEDFIDNNNHCFSMRIAQHSLIVISEKSEDCGRYDDEPEEFVLPLEEVFLELDKLYNKGR